jgi:polyvinyl alcohol dehydrogenase (cytochrome)
VFLYMQVRSGSINRMHLLPLLFAILLTVLNSQAVAAPCDDRQQQNLDPRPAVNGWGFDIRNHRFIRELDAGISPQNISQLKLAWAFALPESGSARAVPLITANAVVIADEAGGIYALDRASGCEHWRYNAGSMVRTALRHVQVGSQEMLVFGTLGGELISLDLASGEERWRIDAGDHPHAMLSGSAVEHAGVIYQPVSSAEVFIAANPFYACCTFRSSVVAVAAEDGEILWRAHTIEEEPGVVQSRRILPDRMGPSGAPVWSQPTLDLKRNLLYVGTGENYSQPTTDTSDAILAFDLTTGEMKWKRQFLAGDAWNLACLSKYHPNCPEEEGEDLDFGAPPILVTISGRDYLLAGQKSGRIFALDPDKNGEVIWAGKIGSGGKAGGVHFAMAVDETRGALYVPISDRPLNSLIGHSFNGTPDPSLNAFNIIDGKPLWKTPAPGNCLDSDGEEIEGCYPGFSAAVTATESLVFAPTLDGYIRAFDAKNGAELWSFNTHRTFESVNAEGARGGSIDVGGVILNNGQLFVHSGYGSFEQLPGNAFLVFDVSFKK